MIIEAAALLLMGMQSAPEAAPDATKPPGQVVFRRQIVIRSVRLTPRPTAGQVRVEWREAKGVRCLPAAAIAGAAQLKSDSVDLVLRNRTRIRAKLASSCPALDYYYGFYITPGEDGLVCSARESVRSRVGGQCEIERFWLLRPVARR